MTSSPTRAAGVEALAAGAAELCTAAPRTPIPSAATATIIQMIRLLMVFVLFPGFARADPPACPRSPDSIPQSRPRPARSRIKHATLAKNARGAEPEGPAPRGAAVDVRS